MMECNILTKIVKRITLVILVLTSLCGCYELGDYEEDEYFEYFPNVELIKKDKSTSNYSVKEYFYTKEGINDFISNIPYSNYLYLVVQVKKDLLLNEFNLSFCSDQDCQLEVSVFILDSVPNDIRGYDDPLYDDSDNLIQYDDPIEALNNKTIFLNANKWTSSYLIDMSRYEYITVNKDQYIVLRFENNSFIGKEKGLSLATFTTTNLLIRAQGS